MFDDIKNLETYDLKIAQILIKTFLRKCKEAKIEPDFDALLAILNSEYETRTDEILLKYIENFGSERNFIVELERAIHRVEHDE